MSRKDFFKDIETVIDDWKNTSFTFISKNDVPGLDDTSLTYGNGEEKKGIEIKNSWILSQLLFPPNAIKILLCITFLLSFLCRADSNHFSSTIIL